MFNAPIKTRRSFLWLLCGIGQLFIALAPASGQTHNHAQPLSVLVDGSKTPDQIPDNLAYRPFILSVAIPLNATSADAAAQADRLRPISLGTADTAALIGALNHVKEQVDALLAEEQRVASDSGLSAAEQLNRVLDLHSARDAFLDAIAVKILSALSPAANAKLDAWIKTGVKPNVKIFGS
jgi:hypothetical protein